ncbi:MAG TPA: hypothetical protein VHK23_10965, partial [Miltoncostaeaceae bacterium]|nr:hypothetical protein [Miltoncostaeaceae bacterium]
MPPVLRRPLAGIAALGAAALIAGCGGVSGSLSADEFREQADAICADADERLETLTEPTAAGEILPFLRAGLPIQAGELGRIEELDPPDELQAAVDEAGELNQQRQELIQGAADRIEAGEDPETVINEVTPEIQRLQEEARAKAQELGLTVCGRADDEGVSTAGGATATAPEATTGTTATAPTARGDTAQYLEDVGAAVASLRSFSSLLQGTTSLEDLQARVPEARAELDSFDDAVAELEGYSFDNATLEAQRAELAESGPRVSD